MHPVGVVVASVTVENASPSASARACRGGPGGKRDCGKGWGGRPGDGGGEVAGHDGACRVGLCRLRWARRIGVGARTWHKAEASVCGTLAQVVMPQKVAGAAGGGGGGRSTCASTVEAAQRSDMALLTTMAAEVADIQLFSHRSLDTNQRRHWYASKSELLLRHGEAEEFDFDTRFRLLQYSSRPSNFRRGRSGRCAVRCERSCPLPSPYMHCRAQRHRPVVHGKIAGAEAHVEVASCQVAQEGDARSPRHHRPYHSDHRYR